MAEPGVSILIPTHNRGEILDRTLRSIAEMDPVPGLAVEVVVVANACTDDTEARVRSWQGRMPFPVVCVAEPRTGLGHARNACVRSSRYDLCALLDDDVWVSRGWLRSLVEVYASTPADMVAGHIELWWEAAPRPAWLTAGMESTLSCLDWGPDIVEMRVPDAVGANFGFRRRVFDAVGGFRTDLDRIGGQLMGGGETMFIQEAFKRGFRLFYAPSVSVKHWVAPHRVQAAYLTGVARGTAYSIIAVKDRFGPVDAARALGFGTARFLGHSVIAAAATLVGAEGRRMRSLVRRAIGQGQMRGAIARLRRGPLGSMPGESQP